MWGPTETWLGLVTMKEGGDAVSQFQGRGAALGGQGLTCLHWGAVAVPTSGRALGTLYWGTQTSVGVRVAGTWWQPPGPSHDGKVRTVRARAELQSLVKSPSRRGISAHAPKPAVGRSSEPLQPEGPMGYGCQGSGHPPGSSLGTQGSPCGGQGPIPAPWRSVAPMADLTRGTTALCNAPYRPLRSSCPLAWDTQCHPPSPQ